MRMVRTTLEIDTVVDVSTQLLVMKVEEFDITIASDGVNCAVLFPTYGYCHPFGFKISRANDMN